MPAFWYLSPREAFLCVSGQLADSTISESEILYEASSLFQTPS